MLKLTDFPDIKAMALPEIGRMDIVSILRAQSSSEMAKRVHWRLRTILDWAIERAEHEPRFGGIVVNPVRFKLSSYLTPSTRPVEHVVSMPFPEVPCFMSSLRGMKTSPHWHGRRKRGQVWETREVPILALLFHILVTGRPDETKGALWSEIDWERKLWLIPGERMKEWLPHGVPLSRQAMVILEHMKARHDGSPFIFPSKTGKKLSTFGKRIPRPYTPHGFRTSFKSSAKVQCGADGRLLYQHNEIVSALSHVIGSVADRAYDRDDPESLRRVTEARRALLQHWADFLDSSPAPVLESDEHLQERIAASPIVSKSEAAAIFGIQRSTFSMMLKRGAIHGPAVTGLGINLEAARAQVGRRVS